MRNLTIIIFLMLAPAVAQGAPSLTVGDVTYENVTLRKEYPRSFFIQHDGGTAFIDRSKLSEEQIADLLGVAGDEMPAVAQTEEEPQASPTPETEAKTEPKTKKAKKRSIIGQEAADMRLIDAEQKETSLSALRGKVVLLNFNLAVGGCDLSVNPEFPILAELQTKYSGEGLEVVSVLQWFTDWNWAEVIQNRAITWKTTVPEKQFAGTPDEKETPEQLKHLEPLADKNYRKRLFAAYDIKKLATNVVVDKNGTIVGHFGNLRKGRQDVETAIAKALAN